MLKEIDRHFDIGDFGVSQASRRIAMKISQDNNLRNKNQKDIKYDSYGSKDNTRE
jgi:hypothetical protein